jgi:hypothetical protein
MKFVLFPHPHTRQGGEVVDLVDVSDRLLQLGRIQNRTFKKVRPLEAACWRTDIENSYMVATPKKRGYQVLPDKTLPPVTSDSTISILQKTVAIAGSSHRRQAPVRFPRMNVRLRRESHFDPKSGRRFGMPHHA